MNPMERDEDGLPPLDWEGLPALNFRLPSADPDERANEIARGWAVEQRAYTEAAEEAGLTASLGPYSKSEGRDWRDEQVAFPAADQAGGRRDKSGLPVFTIKCAGTTERPHKRRPIHRFMAEWSRGEVASAYFRQDEQDAKWRFMQFRPLPDDPTPPDTYWGMDTLPTRNASREELLLRAMLGDKLKNEPERLGTRPRHWGLVNGYRVSDLQVARSGNWAQMELQTAQYRRGYTLCHPWIGTHPAIVHLTTAELVEQPAEFHARYGAQTFVERRSRAFSCSVGTCPVAVTVREHLLLEAVCRLWWGGMSTIDLVDLRYHLSRRDTRRV